MRKSLKEIRKDLKLSTSELAIKLGVSQSTVVRLEDSEAKGTISINSLNKLCEALGCKLEISFKIRKDKSSKDYHGMKRTKASKVKRQSSISDAMKQEEEKLSRSLSDEERILRCLSLSDLANCLQ